MSEPPTYPAPLDRLSTLGYDESEYPANADYLALGLGPEHVPALIAIAIDPLYDTVPLPQAWAPVHAWRALGALRASEAVDALVALLDNVPGDDYMLDDLPRALGQIGPAALPAVARYLAQRERADWSRVAAATAISYIGREHPETRNDCVAVLTTQLRQFDGDDEKVTTFLVNGLIDLHAVEAAPEIEAAFAANALDYSVTGDWEDVQVELGLLEARVTPRPHYGPFRFARPTAEPPVPTAHANRERRAAEKRRRKMAKQSKRRNRRR